MPSIVWIQAMSSNRLKGVCLGPLHIGERALVRNCTDRGGTGKLGCYYENGIYKIVDCKGEDSLAYEVQPEKSQDGKKKSVLHRNMVQPSEAILEEPEGFHLKKEKHIKPKQVCQ